ncbi:type IV toxin-antitoxin system AbiEi family antitoxin [Citrobacter sp. MNAZ 1397]|uniref:type IV toxin-antitoxin system AbiEi family antitoxin n=1 Tax=Citrobacter sp. MNAZ 1397 TaxID=2911205 RepID=UPI002026A45B|nr:type IV toxin-antitoxin system AbiEi family antitoxin [Citrobacter sp. MNAZ 1397]MCL9672721.1 hypothetical protein [Citrobacter sp. MNAZ 1397]
MQREQEGNREQMNDELSIVSEILAQLPPPLKGEVGEHPEGGSDGGLFLNMPDGQARYFHYDVKMQPRKEWLMNWKMLWKKAEMSEEVLLFCDHLTPALQQYCQQNQINFIDSGGNAFISVPGFYLNISGKKSEKVKKQTGRMSIGVMKLLFVLLSDERIINYTYREIAELAGISLGMVGKGFEYLADKKWYRQGRNGRRFTRQSELYQIWIQEYASVLRAGIKSMRLAGNIPWQDIALQPGECWAGDVAGHELSDGYLHPETIKIFTPLSFTERWKTLALRPAPEGSYELIETFWGNAFRMNTQSYALLTIAELVASQDDRSIETARMINERYLHAESAIIG